MVYNNGIQLWYTIIQLIMVYNNGKLRGTGQRQFIGHFIIHNFLQFLNCPRRANVNVLAWHFKANSKFSLSCNTAEDATTTLQEKPRHVRSNGAYGRQHCLLSPQPWCVRHVRCNLLLLQLVLLEGLGSR